MKGPRRPVRSRRHEEPVSGPASEHASYGSFVSFSDPDGNGWLFQEVTTRLPGRVDSAATTFGSASDLAAAMRRASAAHGEHEKRIGAADRELARLVRPVHGGGAGRDGAADVSDYDVIVFGGGAPGEHCAAALAARGLRVAVVERELVGGECSYWACIPSKSLLRPGEAVQGAREAARAPRSTWRRRWPGGTSWCRTIPTPARSAGWRTGASTCCAARGGWPARAWSRSTGVRHTAEHIVVATGADPIVPPVPGLRELEGVWGTREATSMKAVPRRLLVLGGGPPESSLRRSCGGSAARR